MSTRTARRPRPDKPTRPVFSAGAVVFDGKGRLLLLRRAGEGTWCFPKGNIEPGESPEQAAAREVHEESGLEVVLGKRIAEVHYTYYWASEDANYDKRVVYFIAHVRGGEVRLEDRFDAWRWVTPARARALLHYRNDRTVLARALKAESLSGRA